MLTIEENFDLKPFNTFGVPVRAKYFVKVVSENDVRELIHHDCFINNRRCILGGGSNILFTKDFDGLIIYSAIKGISIEKETDENILIKVGSAEIWHQFVMYCVKRNWGGIENLSLIPGQVGGGTTQNIGAYGVEAKDLIQEVALIDLDNGNPVLLSNRLCEFTYRNSVFKRNKKYFISEVLFKLTKKNHKINTNYNLLKEYLEDNNIVHVSIKDISDAVINIRKQKLLAPNVFGNAGSFFMNPIISLDQLMQLKRQFTDMPYYNIDDKTFKMYAGWLIEQCGWKGKQLNNVGVNKNQALVIINLGNATGEEILDFSQSIKSDVYKKFQIQLENEVTII